ncbi:MAG: NnrU family protein [Planctomycetota bacterium]
MHSSSLERVRPAPGWAASGIAIQLIFGATVPWLYMFLLSGASREATGGGVAVPLLVDMALLAFFVVPHSFFLQPSVRREAERWVPRPLQGSIFTLIAIVTLGTLMLGWQPIPGAPIWRLEGDTARLMVAANAAAWGGLLYSMWLSGLGYQTGLTSLRHYLKGEREPRRTFEPRGAYCVLRHPIYLSFLLIAWLTPLMTPAHLLLAVGFTLYSFVGSALKDSRLASAIGEPYRDYMARVPGFPRLALVALALLAGGSAMANDAVTPLQIDPAASELKLAIKKKGVLKAFAHDHDGVATVLTGTVVWDKAKPESSSVKLRISAKDIRIVDAHASKDDKDEMNSILVSDKILDAAKFPEIVFESNTVVATPSTKAGEHALSVMGTLKLHGVSRGTTLKVVLVEKDGAVVVTGEHTLVQSDHGIEPYSAALGSIGVQDAIGISFRIVTKSGGAK